MDDTAAAPVSFVGIDVSKDSLEVAVMPQGQSWRVPYHTPGLDQLIDRLRPLGRTLIVLEATGGWERRAVAELLQAGFEVARVNPRQVRDFAKALGLLAKTDRLDAQVLARFAQHIQPRPLEKTTEKQAELADLVARRRQLVALKVAEQNRLQQTTSKPVRKSVKLMLKTTQRELETIERAIATLIEDHDDWRARRELLESVPGLGQTISATLVAEVPELGRLNRQQIAALIGLAPFNRESGTWHGKRSIRGGRTRVRSALYMAALTAYRCNPIIRRFAQRLTQAGKPFKVMITACMRKLLTILNTIVRTRSPWNQSVQIQSLPS
jgi:transposase